MIRWAFLPLSVLLLAGCATTDGTPFSLEQRAVDVLPDVIPDDQFETASVRSLGQSQELTSYFAVQRNDGSDGRVLTCLVAVRDDESWSSSCSTALPIEVQLDNGEVAVLHEEGGQFEGTSVGEYLSVVLP